MTNEFSLNEVIEMAVQTEKNGYQFYDKALGRKDLSDSAREVITSLRDDEITHEGIFKNMRSSEDYEAIGDPVDWQEAASYLRTISEAHVFNEPDASIKLATMASDEHQIIEYAIQFEKDTLLFFHTIQKNIKDDKTLKILNRIIDEEISHVIKLKNIQNELKD